MDDGGTLSYQWHSNAANGNTEGTPIDDATESTYTPTVPATGTVYYYVGVTNTNNNATSTKTAAIASSAAAVAVTGDLGTDPGADPTNAAAPVISAQPQGGRVIYDRRRTGNGPLGKHECGCRGNALLSVVQEHGEQQHRGNSD